jgi:hypothetical protein
MKPFVVGLVWICLFVAIAIGSYIVKNKVIFKEAELKEVNASIEADAKQIHVLRAELSHLKDVNRLAELAEKYTNLQPLKAEQYISITSVPFKNGGAE